jgi:hypothetical protein
LRYWVALACIVLTLAVTGVEAVHSHSTSGTSSQCAICITVHANAPVIVVHALPVLHAVETVSLPNRTKRKITGVELELFTRPPPAVV